MVIYEQNFCDHLAQSCKETAEQSRSSQQETIYNDDFCSFQLGGPQVSFIVIRCNEFEMYIVMMDISLNLGKNLAQFKS